jgi:two-component system NtrC family response regulator/two-component system response regulator HydG
VLKAESGVAAEAILRTSAVDIVVLDLKLPRLGGLEVLRIAKEGDPDIIVILVTGFPAVETAIAALKAGASDYLVKPFSREQLLAAIEDAREKRRPAKGYALLRHELRRAFHLHGVVGQSRAMLRLVDEVRRAAAVDTNVLILGESGVGKEMVAQGIHENSRRREKPLLALNCAAIPETLLETELFGYERGAFTGAHVSRAGLLETADGGTFLLDEVCELQPALQAKLLRCLEEHTLRRLGGRNAIPFDVRFIASTNRDIREEIRRGRFREDLFFRIDVIEIRVPPLRERREDIPLLAAHFLDVYGKRYGKSLEGLTSDAMTVLTRYPWPGNVRELRNAIERAVAYARGSLAEREDLPATISRAATGEHGQSFHQWKEQTLESLERQFLERTLDEYGGNVTRAARALGIHRSTLQRLMRKHGPSSR